jgi:formate hydrogenlyase subunit 4
MELLLGLALAPLLTGTIRRTKAFLAGRRGPPWLQGYLDLWKLLHKGAVYSRTTSFVFRAGPVLSLACVIGALALAPAGGLRPLAAFPGDFLLLVALLALARFALVLAALDTGSAFEGMGASSLAEILARLAPGSWLGSGGVLALVGVALFGVLLVENSRMPFDDPTTHLELTMVHEVMVLDHGGPDLAAIEWGAMLKLWLFAGLLAGAVVPLPGVLAHGLGILGVGVAVGIVESTMARLRLLRVPQILVAITLLALLSVVLAPGRGA